MNRLAVALAALFACLAPASAQQVFIGPRMSDTNFGDYHILIAEQLASNVCHIDWTFDMTPFNPPWFRAASWSCYRQTQFVLATMPSWAPQMFARSVNEQCDPGPATPAALPIVEDWTGYPPSLRDYRWTHEGKKYRPVPVGSGKCIMVPI